MAVDNGAHPIMTLAQDLSYHDGKDSLRANTAQNWG